MMQMILGKVHPTAIIEEGAELAQGVEIGPYTLVGSNVKIGADTRVEGHVVLAGDARIGERCHIFHGACLGNPSQDKKSKSIKKASLVIGNDNIIREYVTMNSGGVEGSMTVVGDRNFIMIGCHLAHDCRLGNDIVISNNTVFSGHVTVEDRAVISGIVGIHQYVRVGKFSMTGGVSKLVKDVPPFSICDGHPARFYGLNSIGLKRAGYSIQDISTIKKALKILFVRDLRLADAIEKVKEEFVGNKDVEHLVWFVENSKRGVYRSLEDQKASDVVE